MKLFSRKDPLRHQGNIREMAGRLYDIHAPRLLSVCIRYCGNREDAEDVLHESFIKIFSHLDRFREERKGSLEAWMKRIVVNTALNYLRDNARNRQFLSFEWNQDIQDAGDETDPVDDFSGAADLPKEELLGMVCDLPDGYRTVFNLYVMESRTHKEIARILRCTEGTSKSQLSKARAMLRKRLAELKNEKEYEKTTAIHR